MNTAHLTSGPPGDAENPGDSPLRVHLYKEADHYYQSELQNDQRSIWLVALATGLLALDLDALRSYAVAPRAAVGSFWVVTGAACLLISGLLGLLAIWPLYGARAQFFLFQRPPNDLSKHQINSMERNLAITHYLAHRRRATLKARYVVWVLLMLGFGALLTLIGVLRNLPWPRLAL